MANEHFDFKQFSIRQERCAMKVGTDGVLLGAWAGQEMFPRQILDIGTGTGLVALMMAQRFEDAVIDAVEIDPMATAQACENFAASPWSNRLTVACSALQSWQPDAGRSYDLIVSNPPFYNATLKPEDEGRALARHKDALPVTDITRFAHEHLSDDGRLAMIYPTDYDSEVMTAAIVNGLSPLRICDIVTKTGKTGKRKLVEFGLHPLALTTRETLAIRSDNNRYTAEYRNLTADFYMHLND